MKFLRKLKEFFAGSNANEASSENNVAPGSVQQILNLPEAYIHPQNFMEELGVAIVMDTGKPLQLSSSEIKLYQLHDVQNSKLLGSFYGVMIEGKYYGYHLGSKDIISCSPQAFVFKETKRLIVPLTKVNDSLYVLICHYTCDNGRLIPQRFVELTTDGEEKGILHTFEEGTTIGDAFEYCKEEITKL